MPPSDDDAPAFRALYAAHRDAVWRYAQRRLADRDAADDVTTEVFLVAWRRAGEVPAEPLPWLLGVARRVLANHRRADVRRRALHERAAGAGSVAGGAGAAPDPADRLGDRDALRAALAALAEPDREILLLVAWEGLTVAEAAVVLGCRRSAAGVRLHRARRRLRAALDDPSPAATVAAAPAPTSTPSAP